MPDPPPTDAIALTPPSVDVQIRVGRPDNEEEDLRAPPPLLIDEGVRGRPDDGSPVTPDESKLRGGGGRGRPRTCGP